MSAPARTCDPRRIADFLDRRLSAAEQAVLEEHLSECAACRNALRSQTAGAEIWDKASRYLREDDCELLPLSGDAVAAMEQFVDELRSTWPVHRSDFAVGDARGACLLDLNLMPELAPCYVASPKALVVGWNPASLRTALESPAASALGGEGGAIVDLSRFGEADARLSEHFARESRPDPQTLPWQRLSLRSRRNGGGVQVRARLEGSPSPRLEGSTS